VTTELRIERLGHRGDGVAAGPVFVPLTLPGEKVEGVVENGRMPAPRILVPSPDRVKAPCSHFKSCGGCSLQHASDSFVVRWKSDVVLAALASQGISASIASVAVSPPQTRRRATLSGRRTKKGATIGFHARASDTVVEIPNCVLLHPDILAAIPLLRDITVLAASRKGEISFAVTQSSAGVDVSVTGGKELDDRLRSSLPTLLEKHKAARLCWDGEPLAQRQPPYQPFGNAQVLPPPGAFLQATAHGQDALVRAVQSAVGEARSIADLFAGCGTFALPLAAQAEILAVEDDADMLAALDAAWRNAKGLKLIKVQTRDLFRRPLMPDELKKTDAVVIDPPRAGAEAQMNELAQSNVATIVAVSCNPVTFGRDATILIDGGYRLEQVDIVDQFRWSSHIEIIAKFVR